MTQRILIVLHQERSSPGRVAQALLRRGCELDIRRPALGDPLPETMAAHDAAIIFGGPMSANDELPFIKAETDWIGVPLKEEKPYLGICLGGQMLARHLGARVWAHPESAGRGWLLSDPADRRGAGISSTIPNLSINRHREGFELPSGAVQLAEGAGDFPVQAMRYGDKAYGIQFHPELTPPMMNAWLTLAAERLKQPGAQ